MKLGRIAGKFIGFLLLGGLLTVTIAFESVYRHVLSGLEPLPVFQELPPLPPKVASTLWCSEAKGKPRQVTRIYGWNLYKIFDEEDRSPVLACQLARPIAHHAHDRSPDRTEGHWHLRYFVASVWVSRSLSTEQILANIAQDVWMGAQYRGFAGAAHRLFRKELAELDYPEIAVLVAISRNPNGYDPIRHPERAIKGRNRVLARLFEAGILSASELGMAQSCRLGVLVSSS